MTQEVGAGSSVNTVELPLLVYPDSVNILRRIKGSSKVAVVAYQVMVHSPAVGSLIGLIWVVGVHIPEWTIDVGCEGWGNTVGP